MKTVLPGLLPEAVSASKSGANIKYVGELRSRGLDTTRIEAAIQSEVPEEAYVQTLVLLLRRKFEELAHLDDLTRHSRLPALYAPKRL